MRKLFSFSFFIVGISLFLSCEEEASSSETEVDDTDPCLIEPVYTSFQAQIDASSDGDTIIIDPGTYEGTVNFNGKNIVLGSQFLTTGDTSYIRTTIINAKQKGSVVRFENNETNGAALVGLTLMGGYAVEGAGIYINGAEPTLRDLRVVGNAAYTCEVGEFFKGASGGGIFINGSSPVLERITVRENSSEADGGGVYLSNSDANLTLVTIFQNTAADLGGGLFTNYSTSKVLHVEIAQNSSSKGGGVYAMSFSDLSFENSNVGDNTASSEGGGFYLSGSKVKLLNVVLRDNTANDQGGSYFLQGGTIELMNTISHGGSPQEVYSSSSGNLVKSSYSLLAGGVEGIEMNNAGEVNWMEGNVDGEPGFSDAGEGCIWEVDRTFLGFFPKSICVDAGNPFSTYNDIPQGPEKWCLWWMVWRAEGGDPDATEGEREVFLETNTDRNDIGAYGGPNGGWRRNPR